MKKTGITVAILLALSLELPDNGRCDELGESYYPLKEGMRWEYLVTSNLSDTKKLIISRLAPREVQGKKVTPRKWDMGENIFIEFMEKDETGVYRYAEQVGEKGAPTLVTPKECHLKFPITEGNSWNMTTKLGNSILNVTLTLESISEEVGVPAGAYKDCLKIKQMGGNGAGDPSWATSGMPPRWASSRAWSPLSKNLKRELCPRKPGLISCNPSNLEAGP